MTVAFLFLVAAFEVIADQPAEQLMQCSLTSPAGDLLAFRADASTLAGEEIVLVPAGGVWPQEAVRGRRFTERAFALDTAGGDFVVNFAVPPADYDWQPVTLYQRRGARVGLPLAYGFCSSGSAAPEIASMGARGAPDGSPFDPERWSDDCALLTTRGVRTRIDYSLRDVRTVTIEGAEIWPGRTITVERRQAGNIQQATFGGADGPAGLDMLFIEWDPARRGSHEGSGRGARLLQFQRLRGTGARDDAGFAICGIRSVVMRPSFR